MFYYVKNMMTMSDNTIYNPHLIQDYAREIMRHALGNTKYTRDLQVKYVYIKIFGTPELGELLDKVLRNRGMKIE